MKAVVYKEPFKVSVEEVSRPKIQHAIVRISTTAICGSDLHMYEGRTSAKSGIVFGHENLGIVEDVGSTWGQFFGIHTSNDGRIMIFAGGIPLKRNGKVVGAIGVSGVLVNRISCRRSMGGAFAGEDQ